MTTRKTILISKKSSVQKPPITTIIAVIFKKIKKGLEAGNPQLSAAGIARKVQILFGTPDIVSRHTGCGALF